jgi:hypothetical protein
MVAEAKSMKSFPERTVARRLALEAYMRSQVLNGNKFICNSETACRASVPIFLLAAFRIRA